MIQYLRLLCALATLALPLPNSLAQTADTSIHHVRPNHMIIPPDINAAFVAAGYGHGLYDELNADIGLGYVSLSDVGMVTVMDGAGYTYLFSKGHNNYYRLFLDADASIALLGISVRGEFLANERFNKYYARPYIGISIVPAPPVHIDVQYSYAFLLNSTGNDFKGGITLRAKVYLSQKQWKYVGTAAHRLHSGS